MDAEGNIATKDEKKDEVLNACFASTFNKKTVIIKATSPVSWWTKSRIEPLTINEKLVSDPLSCLGTQKCRGPDGIHPRVLGELLEELTKTLSIIY